MAEEKLLRSRLRIQSRGEIVLCYVIGGGGHCAWPWSYRFSKRVATKPTSRTYVPLSRVFLSLSLSRVARLVHCYSESKTWTSLLLYFVWRDAPCNRITRLGNWNHSNCFFFFFGCVVIYPLGSFNYCRGSWTSETRFEKLEFSFEFVSSRVESATWHEVGKRLKLKTPPRLFRSTMPMPRQIKQQYVD